LHLSWFKMLTSLPDAIGSVHSLRSLSLVHCCNLEVLPDNISSLSLSNLHLEYVPIRDLKALASMQHLQTLCLISVNATEIPELTCTKLLQLRIIRCIQLKKIPDCIAAMTSLSDLCMYALPAVDTTLELDLLQHTRLTSLSSGMSTLFHSLTKLRHLRLGCQQDNYEVSQRVADAIPLLTNLKTLVLEFWTPDGESLPLTMPPFIPIILSLRAWPQQLLHIFNSPFELKMYQKELQLPTEATNWNDTQILEFFRVQQKKAEAFAMGLHPRLGVSSLVYGLGDIELIIIIHLILGDRFPQHTVGQKALGLEY
jgi:hypothetical protein